MAMQIPHCLVPKISFQDIGGSTLGLDEEKIKKYVKWHSDPFRGGN